MSTPTADWSTFYAQLRGYVATRVRSAADTDDLVQIILERATAKAGSIERAEGAPAWLFGIARNAIIDHYRVQRRGPASKPDAWENVPESDATFSDAARSSVLACIEPLLLTLPAPTQQLLRWADMEDRSMQFIATQLDLTVTATKSRVQRARQELVTATRRCCAITLDARGRVTDLTPKGNISPVDCSVCPPGNAAETERKPS